MLSLDKRVDEVYMNKNQELLWLLKHPNLYTGGISAPDDELIDKNKFPVFKTNRGGKWTFHGDGQKVVYFVMNLNKRDKANKFLFWLDNYKMRKLFFIEKCFVKHHRNS